MAIQTYLSEGLRKWISHQTAKILCWTACTVPETTGTQNISSVAAVAVHFVQTCAIYCFKGGSTLWIDLGIFRIL
jgi:hypothetical protein